MKKAFIIVKKELIELLRDKSTYVFFLIPLFVFPLLNTGLKYINKNHSEIRITINSSDTELNRFFDGFISKNNNISIKKIESKEPRLLLSRGEIDCYIETEESALFFICDPSSYNSLSNTTKLGELFQAYYLSEINDSFKNVYIMNLKDSEGNNVDPGSSVSLIVSPILLVILCFQSATVFANNTFAGEKERKTLELLFLAGVKRKTIYCGKLLSLIAVSFTNTLLSMMSFFVFSCFSDTGAKQFSFMQREDVVFNIVKIIIIVLMLSFFTIIICLLISMISDSMKKAQITNEIITAVPASIFIMSEVGVISNNVVFRYIPIVNGIFGLQSALKGQLATNDLLVIFLTNMLINALIVKLSLLVIKKEKILL